MNLHYIKAELKRAADMFENTPQNTKFDWSELFQSIEENFFVNCSDYVQVEICYQFLY